MLALAMKQWVQRNAIHAQLRCMDCGLLDADTDHAEMQAVDAIAVDRHSVCNHIVWWRNEPVDLLPFLRQGARPRCLSDRLTPWLTWYHLSPREFEVAMLLAAGMRSDDEIALAMGLSTNGVNARVFALAAKLHIPKGSGRRRRLVRKLEQITPPRSVVRHRQNGGSCYRLVEHNKGDS